MTVEDRLRDALIARADALAGPDGDLHPADVVVPLSARRSGWVVIGVVAAVAALVLGAVAMIDRPERPQRVAADKDSLPGDQALVYVFEKDNQIWGVTRSGDERQLTHEARWAARPRISPDGRTLFYRISSNSDYVVDDLVALDLSRPNVRPSRPIAPSAVVAIAPNGDVAAAGISRLDFLTIEVLDHSRGFAERSTITLGQAETPGCESDCLVDIRSLAWDTDSRRLLAVTGGPKYPSVGVFPTSHQLWSIDTETGKIDRLTVQGERRSGWRIGQAVQPGVFPAVAGGGFDTAQHGATGIGLLRVDHQSKSAALTAFPTPDRGSPLEPDNPPLELYTPVSVDLIDPSWFDPSAPRDQLAFMVGVGSSMTTWVIRYDLSTAGVGPGVTYRGPSLRIRNGPFVSVTDLGRSRPDGG